MPPETQKGNLGRRYAVFLSYRHADNKDQGRQWATWLHQVLEGYEIPADLVGTKNSKGDLIPSSLYPVFRDEEELPADADLTRNIRQALENSSLLVVLCSPRAVESRFVADEIRYFKELGKADCILALMIDGEPSASEDPGKARLGIRPEAECLPKPLRYGVARNDGEIDWDERTEPIAADTRPERKPEQGWTTSAAYREALYKERKFGEKEITQKAHEYEQRLELAKLKVVAGALGVPLGVLTKRDKAMQLRKARRRARTLKLWLAAVGVLAILVLAGGIYAWLQRQEAVKQRDLVATREAAARNTASETDFAIADLKLRSGDVPTALAHLARSLRNNPANMKAAARIASLSTSRSYPIGEVRHEDYVMSARFNPDGKWIVTASLGGTARVWEAQTGRALGEPMRHEDYITAATFSPNGKWIVTASEDKTARVWDAQSGKAVGEPMRHEGRVSAASFSPDGKWIVTASWDKTARVWDAQSGEAVGEPLRHEDDVTAASFSPDGKWIVTVSGSPGESRHSGYGDRPSTNMARIWNAKSGKTVGEPMRHEDGVNGASFSPDGKWIVTASLDKTARVWDAQSGNAVGWPMRHEFAVHAASFSPDGKWILTASGPKAAVWDAQSGNVVGEPVHPKGAVHTACFSPDGKWILTASGDKTASIWEAQTGKAVGEPMRHEVDVRSASFSPDGKWIVTVSENKTTRVWDAQVVKAVSELMRHENDVNAASFSPDGKWIVTASKDKTARVWEAQSGKAVGDPMRHENDVVSASFSPDGKWVVTALWDHTAQLWEAQSGKAVGHPMRHVMAASFSPGLKWIVTASKTAQVWDAQSGKAVGEPMRHEDGVNGASFSPDGKWIVTASLDKTARVWDARSGKAVGEPMRHEDNVDMVSFSPDGKWIVTASSTSSSGTVRIWDAQSGTAVGHPMPHEGIVTAASFSPDGKWIVTASWDTTARVWAAQGGQAVGEPMRPGAIVFAASFSPDGKWIVTVSADQTARVWDALSGKAVGEPTRQENHVRTASFSPDGRWIVSASWDNTARLWEAGIVTSDAPEWLLGLAEALGGLHFNLKGVLEPVDKSLSKVREELRHLAGNDDLSRLGRWLVADPFTRTISPLSSVTVPEFVSQRLAENALDSVEEAYRVDPGNPLIVASLAKFEKNKDKALFLCRHATKRARVEGGGALVEKVRATVLTVFPDFTE